MGEILQKLNSWHDQFQHLGFVGILAYAGAMAFIQMLFVPLAPAGIGAGAIAQVIVQITPSIRDRESKGPLLSPLVAGGLLSGLLVMYVTGLMVSV